MPGLVWDLIAKDGASPAFLRVAGAADKAAASTAKAAASSEAAVVRMGKAGAALTKHLTLPLAAVAAVSVDQAAKFQKSMTLIQTAGGESAAKAAAISVGIKKVATETGTSLSQLGEGIYTVAKAGAQKWSAAGQLEVLKAAAQGAKAENVDLGTAVDGLTTIMFDYGAKTSDAVKYQDMLIRGSGLAKTSMRDYVASLSNVVPVAAATGISFEQVGGAIATMTQHGVTAQQATENLRNLITNLAGQNNVASSAMQQLGINTVDLAKNLGTRGLTGTLAIVDRALKTHSKNGLIVTSTYKVAALANQSLKQELGTFGGALASQSKGLLSGSVDIKAYTQFAKSLGGTAGASALQFLALYKSSQGFSDQLRSGKGTITTTTAALNKMLGGITGSSVALQLGVGTSKEASKYAAQFAANTREIGKASLEAGSDVLGWNKTQDTLAVKLDKAKASLQVMAVEIGTALIPAVSKVVDWVAKAVHWFDSLSSGDKKFLGWSAVVLAAIGPVLSIFSRLILAVRLLPGLFLTASTSAGGMATATGAAMRGVGLAIAGVQAAAGGYFAGNYTSGLAASHLGGSKGFGSSSASDRFRAGSGTVLAGAAGGAAAGAALGTIVPGLGTAAGGIVGGLVGTAAGVVKAFGHMNDAAKNAQKAAKAALDAQNASAKDLLSTLQQVGGAYNDQVRGNVVNQLTSSGTLKIANKAGVNLQAVVSGVLGDSGQAGLAKLNAQLENAAAAGKITFTQLDQVQRAIGVVGKAASSAESDLELQNRAMHGLSTDASMLGTKYGKLQAALAGTGSALDTVSAAGKHNTAVIGDNVTVLNKTATAQLAAGRSVNSVATNYKNQINALEANAVKLGLNRDQVDALIAKYAKLPKSVVTQLQQQGISTLNPVLLGLLGLYRQMPQTKTTTFRIVDHATNTLTTIRQALDHIQSKVITVTTRTANANGSVSVATNRFGLASGGTAPDGYFSVGEQGPEIVHKRGTRVDVMSNSASKAFIAATGAKFPGFASGTGVANAFASLLASLGVGRAGRAGALGNGQAESGFSTTALNSIGALGVFQWLGGRKAGLERLASRMGVGANTEKAQLAFFKQELTGPFRSVLNGLRSATSARSAATLFNNRYEISGDTSGRRENNAAQIYQQMASGKLGGGLTVGGQTYASLRAARNAAERLKKTLAALRVKISGPDIDRLKKSLTSTAYEVRTAFNTILSDVTKVGAQSPLITMIKGVETRLLAVQAQAAKAKTLLTGMTTYRSGIASTLTGAFDPTRAGSVADLIAGYSGATGTNKAYASELNKLRAKTKGNKTLTGLINTLAASGQTATLQTLAGASGGQLAQVAKSVGAYNSSVAAGADAATTEKYNGNSVAAQTRNVNKLTTEMSSFTKVVAQLAHEVGRQTITVSIDGEKHAAKVTNSKAMAHLLAELEHIIEKGHH